jgi:hypothetical protein
MKLVVFEGDFFAPEVDVTSVTPPELVYGEIKYMVWKAPLHNAEAQNVPWVDSDRKTGIPATGLLFKRAFYVQPAWLPVTKSQLMTFQIDSRYFGRALR